MTSKTYKYEDLFQDDPENPGMTLLTIPPEILEAKGWTEGTRIKISVGDQGSLILSDLDEKEPNGKE
jgi:hypothetical protein